MSEDAPPPLTNQEISDRLEKADVFMRDMAPHLGRLFGMDLDFQVGMLGEGAGMATNRDGGGVVIDPRFFLERGYSAEETAYGIMHETAAHVKLVVANPTLNSRVTEFSKRGEPQKIFNNVFEDIAGNNLIHAVLPRQKQVAETVYRDRLFPGTDYTDMPRHMQFIEKIIRDEMVPSEIAKVNPEVDEAIAGLRDYQGQGDLIKYSTAVAKSGHEAMTPEERFRIWTGIIYPVYEKLLEQDREDPRFQSQPNNDQPSTAGESGDQSSDPQKQQGDSQNSKSEDGKQSEKNEQSNGESQSSQESQTGEGYDSDKTSDQPDSAEGGQKPSSSQSGQSDQQRFGDYYQDYHDNKHPEPFSEEEEQKLEDQIRQKMASGGQRPINHQRLMDEQVRKETGHSLSEKRRYDAEVVKWQEAIEDMRQTWQSVINERIAQKRGLSRRNFTEGAVLDPDRLVQTVIDVRNQVDQPEAFRDYETRRGQTETVGKTDYIFIGDISSSMAGEKAQASASSSVILLEGLAALQRDIEEAEAAHKLDLELDIRTAIYTFGIGTTNTKALSTKVSPKERLDSYQALSNPRDGDTQDYLAFEEVEKLPDEPDRRRIIIVLSDGISGDSSRTKRSVDRLRGRGWYVYGISIGSDEAEQLYSPTARRIDDPEQVPGTIRRFIEATIV